MTAPQQPMTSPHQPNPEAQPKQRLEIATNWINLIVALAGLAMSGLLTRMAISKPAPGALIPAAGFAITFILSLFLWTGRTRIPQWQRVWFSIGPLYLALVFYTAQVQNSGLPMAASVLVASFIIASWGLEGRRSDTFITVGIIAAMFCSLADTYPLLPQMSEPNLVIIGYLFFVLMTSIYTVMLITRRLRVSLRTMINLGALLILLVPLSIIAVIDNNTMRSALQNQTNQALKNSANLMASRVDEFIKTNRASIATEALMQVYANYLAVDPRDRDSSAEARELQIAIESLRAGLKVKERAYLVSFALLDQLGNNVYSSIPAEVGQTERETNHFLEPIRSGRVFDSNIEFSREDNQPYIYFSQIVKDKQQEIVGVLRARFDAMIFQSFAKEFTGALSENSYPILLDEHFIRLAEPVSPVLQWKAVAPLSDAQVSQLKAEKRLPAHDSVSQLYAGNAELGQWLQNMESAPFFTVTLEGDTIPDSAAAVKLTSRPWTVVFTQGQDVLLTAMKNQSRRATLVATLIAGVVALLSTLAAELLNNPIQALTKTAEEISRGNLEAKARVTSDNELGTLGNAFNFMTAQIQNLINGLEDRVQERTKALAQQNEALRFRARQFETVADVARGVASSQELEELLSNVTQLVSDRFEFYHVGIFLLDERREYAVLRAANSEGGQRMLARKHQLQIGQTGMVGYVTANGEARIATDVGQDAAFFNNPDLPLTRSEMALALKVGDQIIGALDVQSTEPNAFSQDDMQLFGILADQVAIAIYNNRLYSETAQALDDAQRVHQRYLRQAWQHELENNQHHSYRFNGETTNPLTRMESPEIESSLQTGRAVVVQNGSSALAVPVKVRGETIGVIRLREDNPRREWDEEETNLVQTIADQMAVALENARLFTQTTRRAERERKVLEITSKIRSTNDPQAILRIAAEELKLALNASQAQIILQPGETNGAEVSEPSDAGELTQNLGEKSI